MNIYRRMNIDTFHEFLRALILLQVAFYTFMIFSPYLMINSIADNTCSSSPFPKGYGAVIFSNIKQNTQSVFQDISQNDVFNLTFLVVSSYIAALLRIIYSNYAPKSSIRILGVVFEKGQQRSLSASSRLLCSKLLKEATKTQFRKDMFLVIERFESVKYASFYVVIELISDMIDSKYFRSKKNNG
ncbi:hypothetical protein RF11_06275 [Thelohanellus kitauei]|uniref:Uncharacterized protein n=1 Tax=Thelohanellus kitauei TaxID=669202 RepID=A0A0C2M6I1_THEKT|nr:hypothetical protein RF11_06275 [Thelohanellus kitauei]